MMMLNDFKAHVQRIGGKVGVSLRGACTDAAAARQMEGALQEAIANGLLVVWIDCQRLTPMTWQGQRAILNADRLARTNGVTLHWCGMSGVVLEQLAASRLNLLLCLQPAANYKGPPLLLQDKLPDSTQSRFFYNK
jgi:anti-anti-sigma regulatory factor